MAIRLYLVPMGDQQPVLDVPEDSLVLYDGAFVDPRTAPAVTLTAPPVVGEFEPFVAGSTAGPLTLTAEKQIKVCWREPVATVDNPSPIFVPDPAEGECVCGITCIGNRISYVTVTNVT